VHSTLTTRKLQTLPSGFNWSIEEAVKFFLATFKDVFKYLLGG
jgi:hypothetical protein